MSLQVLIYLSDVVDGRGGCMLALRHNSTGE